MNEKLEGVLELPLQYRIGFVVFVVGLIAGGYYFLLYPEMGAKLQELAKSIDALKLEASEKRGIVANLPKFEKEVERLNIELQKALRELPDEKEIDRLLARISDKARDAGLRIPAFEPQAEKRKDFYAEVPVQIQVIGTYHQVASFFDEVARLERIVNMDQFSMVNPSPGQGGLMITTSAVATSFRFLEERERPKVDEKKKGRRRGKRRSRG